MEPAATTTKDLEQSKTAEFLFFDFETYINCDGKLVPNLAVVQDGTGEEWIFPEERDQLGTDVTESLCQFLFQSKHKDHYVLAHNFKVLYFEQRGSRYRCS